MTVTLPVHNAVGSIARTIEDLLAMDYPRELLQLLVISDASSDGTDEVVRGFALRGVELMRMPDRMGKTAAENAAVQRARGEIIVNVDAAVLVPSGSLKPLIRTFADPTVGVASGRDVSVSSAALEGTAGESGYVDYEMWVRDLETQLGSIVGASGCFYAIRRRIHVVPLAPELSWDFASALVARELGYRTVSVRDAVCMVPRTAAVRTERSRKTRTMARGLSTLFHKRALMNPLRYGVFALMLVSHKLLRWLPYLLMPVALAALCLLAVREPAARWLLLVAILGIATGIAGIRRTYGGRAGAPLRLAGFVVAVFAAGLVAWIEALRRTQMATWEPTPRPRPSTA